MNIFGYIKCPICQVELKAVKIPNHELGRMEMVLLCPSCNNAFRFGNEELL